jgi:hypothetical protein
MKIVFITLIIVLSGNLCFGQAKKNPAKKPVSKKTAVQAPVKAKEEVRTDNFAVTETQEARFKGTDEELVTFFMQNIMFDSASVKANAEGQVMISLTVNGDSSVTNPIIMQKFGYNVDDQVVSLAKRLKFIPAKMNGVTIRSNNIISIPLRAYFH